MSKFIVLSFIFSFCACSHFRKAAWLLSSNPYPQDKASVLRGKSIYQEHCLRCHGKSALGNGPEVKELKTKPSNLVKISHHKSDSSFAGHVSLGKSTNDEMPAFRNTLTESQIWDVTNYIYSLPSK